MIQLNSSSSSGIQTALLQEDEPLELISLLDVILLLLIFFILTSGATHIFTEIELPRTNQKTENTPASTAQVLIEIPLISSTWNVNGITIQNQKDLKTVILKKLQQSPHSVFVLAPERTLPVERFLWLLNFLKEQKIQNIQILNNTNTSPAL